MSPDNYSFIRKYSLKQITPMLHFQHDENGACIRSSELKPKLDKFLLSKPVKSSADNLIPNIWKQKGQDKALNYKVFIIPEDNSKVIKSDTINRDIKIHSISKELTSEEKKAEKKRINGEYSDKGINGLYFGNMVKYNEPNYNYKVRNTYKETVFYEHPITLKIVCHLPKLLEHIDEYIEEFFAVTNFGTRQNKGFGSFCIIKDSRLMNIDNILNTRKYCYIRASIPGKMSITKEEGFTIASAVYSVMKGGINFPGLYIKGYIQRQYLDDIGSSDIGSDKAFVKSKILPADATKRNVLRPASKKPDDEPERGRTYNDYLYIRSLLGVADHVEYKDPDGLRKGTVKISSDKVERFPSIVTIKISENAVYFIINDPSNKIFNKEFEFSGLNTDKIFTPSSFNKTQFKNGFITYFNRVKNRFINNNKLKMCKDVDLR